MAGNDIVELVEYGNTPERRGRAAEPRRRDARCASRRRRGRRPRPSSRRKGIDFLSEVNTVDEGVLAGWRWVYFLDPDGITVELVEVAYFLAEERKKGIAEYLANRPCALSP